MPVISFFLQFKNTADRNKNFVSSLFFSVFRGLFISTTLINFGANFDCYAAYSVELINGGKFVTSQYWEKNGQIQFYCNGGMVGLNKNDIKKIEEFDMPESNKNTASVTDNLNPIPAKIDSQNLSKTNSTPDKKEDILEDDVLKDFTLLKERFKHVDTFKKQQLYQLANDLTGFRNKILANGTGHIYTDQLAEMLSMLDKIESNILESGPN